jgi:hypothetical protein
MPVSFGISMRRAKAGFFDREKVLASMDKATAKALSKFGAFVRRSARDLIRPRKAIAPPGSPPSSHSGLLRRFIFFSYDSATRSVVIGPVKLNQRDGTAPPLLEFGGSVDRRERKITVKVDAGRDENGRFLQHGTKQVVLPAGRATYKARPFMGPAFDTNLDQASDMFARTLTR